MAPFHTKGWPYYEKFQEIIPNASVRGSNTFSAMHTAPPNALDQTIDLDGLDSPLGPSDVGDPQVSGSGAKVDIGGNDNRNISDLIDIDNDGESSMVISASSGKHKLDISALMGTLSAEPAPKGNTTTSPSVASSSQSILKSSSGPPSSKAPSSSAKAGWPSHQVPSSSKQTSSKISPTLLVHEMQGTISSLAMAVRDAGATDPVAKLQQEAIHQVSQRDDDLSPKEKLMIIKLFTRDYTSVQTYLALVSFDNLRKAWLVEMIEEHGN